MKKKYRLGEDMGSTSLGWCMLELDNDNKPLDVINMGVRIFPDGREDKSKEPLSAKRRSYRGIRRNLDRYQSRLKRLWNYLDEVNFLPADRRLRDQLLMKDPYEIRKRALDEKISIEEFARAMIHLAKRRGFKSNKKTLSKDSDSNKLTEAIKNLKEQLAKHNSRTVGEYLWLKNRDLEKDKQHMKNPLRFQYKTGLSEEDRIFPTRDMIEHEFDLIYDKQAEYHNCLTDIVKEKIHNIIFFQLPMKPPLIGSCYLEPDEKRCAKANPFFQEFRIRQDVNNLRLVHIFDSSTQELTPEQKEIIFNHLNTVTKASLASLRRKILDKKIAPDYIFNIESDRKKDLKGNDVNNRMLKNEIIAPVWEKLSLEDQARIIEILTLDQDDEITIRELKQLNWLNLTPVLADAFMDINLPDGYASISQKAISRILPLMRKGLMYSEACEVVGYKHSDDYPGVVFDEGNLPYYGELLKREAIQLQRISHDSNADKYGRINNPTVHIALNQLRKLINTLTKRYGAPEEINIELAREIKLSREDKEKLDKIRSENEKQNIRIARELAELGIANNYENRTKYKLWEELNKDPLKRCCVYTGKQISQSELFSPEYEIEHILPKSHTYDDGIPNKTVSHRDANRYKGERSPFEAFGDSNDGYNWQEISQRALELPPNKRWRFLDNAMERFADEDQVLARMLNDTRYMSRSAKKYLQYVAGKDNVIPVTGKLTSELRRRWGLNKLLSDIEDKKERRDHRHHAIDAFVIALTTRSFIKRYASTVKNSKERFIEGLGLPYEGFDYNTMKKKLKNIKVSYKPDHPNPAKLRKRTQTAGPLTEETAYNLFDIDSQNSKFGLFSLRKDIYDVKQKDIENIVSPEIRKALAELIDSAKERNLDFKDLLRGWADDNNVKKVKMLFKKDLKTMVPVKDKHGKIYKYYSSAENLYAEIYCPDPEDDKCKWQIEVINSYNAHQPGFLPEWKQLYPKGKLIMRIYKNDVIAFTNKEGERELRRIRKMTSSGIIYLRELHVSKKDKGKEDIGEAFSVNQLHLKKAAKAGIDITGRLHDPGAER